MFTVTAWLPGTENFAATDATGKKGFLDAETGEFREMFPAFESAAVAKYGYQKFPTPFQVPPEQLKVFSRVLNARVLNGGSIE